MLVAAQQLFSLSLILKMFVYFRGDTFKAGWGTSQVSLVIIKSAKKTLRVTMAAKIATYLSASHYFDLSINGNEKMCHKEDFRVDWHLKATNDALEPVRKMSRSCQEAAEVPGAYCSHNMYAAAEDKHS